MLSVVRQNPSFARLWYAQMISGTGDWLNRVAVIALIGELGGQEAFVGVGMLFALEFATRMLPTALLAPIAGPVADRVSRRALMVTSDLVNAATVPCFLFVREPEHLPLLYGLVVLQMGISMFFHAARQGALPNTVPKESLHEAMALSAATWSLVLSVGSVLGGLLIAAIGRQGVFLIDSLTYIVSALVLVGLKLPPVPARAEPFHWKDILLFRDVRKGFAHIRALGLTPMLFTKTMWGGCGGYLVMLSVVGKERFGMATAELTATAAAGAATSLLFAARGVGTGIGPIIAQKLLGQSDLALKRQISSGFLIAVIGYAGFAIAPTLPLAFLAVAFAHLGGSALWVASTTYIQKKVDDEFRGRAFALDFQFMTVSFIAGGFLAGWLHDGGTPIPSTVLLLCGCVLVMGSLWTWFARERTPRAKALGELE